MMTTSIKDLIDQSIAVSNFAEINLQRLSETIPKDDHLGNEEFDYFLGLIRRQFVLTADLNVLFSSRTHASYITSYIVSRCILDDYITLNHIISSNDVRESIIKCNAHSWDQNIKKLSFLADANERLLGGNAPFYPTHSMIEFVKESIKSRPEFQEYFRDPNNKVDNDNNLLLKKFLTTKQIVEQTSEEQFASFARIFYLWGHFSTYIHYSTLSYKNELVESENCNNFVNEAIYYSYSVILNSLQYFLNKYNIDLADPNNLQHHYSRAEKI